MLLTQLPLRVDISLRRAKGTTVQVGTAQAGRFGQRPRAARRRGAYLHDGARMRCWTLTPAPAWGRCRAGSVAGQGRPPPQPLRPSIYIHPLVGTAVARRPGREESVGAAHAATWASQRWCLAWGSWAFVRPSCWAGLDGGLWAGRGHLPHPRLARLLTVHWGRSSHSCACGAPVSAPPARPRLRCSIWPRPFLLCSAPSFLSVRRAVLLLACLPTAFPPHSVLLRRSFAWRLKTHPPLPAREPECVLLS